MSQAKSGDAYCVVCRYEAFHECVCPTCPICETVGDPGCYGKSSGHRTDDKLILTKEQIIGRSKAAVTDRKRALEEAISFLTYVENTTLLPEEFEIATSRMYLEEVVYYGRGTKGGTKYNGNNPSGS